jgi:hypothetical protein
MEAIKLSRVRPTRPIARQAVGTLATREPMETVEGPTFRPQGHEDCKADRAPRDYEAHPAL